MKRVVGWLLLSVLLAMSCSGLAVALADVSRSFLVASGVSVIPGQLVSTEGNADHVTLADTDNGVRLVGVALPAASALLAIDASTGLSKVEVAVSGTASVYVSTLNGDIRAGDIISVSPFSGIGMKAEAGLRAIGVAQADFTSKSAGAKEHDVKDKSGHLQNLFIGSVPVVVNIGNGSASSGVSGILGNLQTVAASLVGHQVSIFRVALSFLVTIIAIGALIALVYGAIHGGIVAIGRNPLARESIYKSLVGVMAMAFLIVLLAIAILYFTLR